MPGSRRASWGWHRLTDEWAETLVELSGVRRGDLVLDVGAGGGALTKALLERGATVVAVELHGGRAETLRRTFAGEAVKVVRADAADLRLPTRPFKVVANPPFNVTSSLIRRLTAPGSALVSAHLVLQRGAARRWECPGCARHRRHAMAVECLVPRRAFVPPPTVDAAVLVVSRRPRR